MLFSKRGRMWASIPTIATIIVILLTGCTNPRSLNSAEDSGKISVVATIFAPYDFAREIAGNMADITMLLPPASESHSYEPSARDIIKIQNCDVFIHVGGESDAWVEKILRSMDTDSMRIVTLMDCVEAVEEEIVDGMEHGEEDEDEHDEYAYDEHVWTSPRNAKLIVQKISTAICEADELNADNFVKNTAAYMEKLDALDVEFQSVINNAVRKTVVFGDRFPFRYLADAYGLEYFAAFPGCAHETEPSADTVAFLINKVRSDSIPAVFHAELSTGKIAGVIAAETGAKALLLHACHNISKDDFENGASYISLMTQNAEALREALS